MNEFKDHKQRVPQETGMSVCIRYTFRAVKALDKVSGGSGSHFSGIMENVREQNALAGAGLTDTVCESELLARNEAVTDRIRIYPLTVIGYLKNEPVAFAGKKFLP